ncbi:MAG: AMP-binding protein [Candidatus Aenigmarchaeota archaeon]|nr:AMP-binding protein [Candidatus Aenigmarchaeota archaeon]
MGRIIKPVPRLFFETSGRLPEKPAIYCKTGTDYSPFTYGELGKRVENVSAGLVNLGLEDSEIAILCNHGWEWATSSLSIMSIKGRDVPIYNGQPVKYVEYVLNDSGAKAIVVSGKELQKVMDIRKSLPELRNGYIITLDGESDHAKNILSFNDIVELGKGDPRSRNRFNELLRQISLQDPATIIYTSGTTSDPEKGIVSKGVILPHLSLAYNALACGERIGISENDVLLSLLPPEHSFERNDLYFTLVNGASVYISSPMTAKNDMKIAKPTIVPAVPLFFQKMHKGIMDIVNGKPRVEQKAFEYATKISKAYHRQRKDNGFSSLAPLDWLARKVVYREISKKTGGKVRVFVSGGAQLRPDISEDMEAWGLEVAEGYGTTENGPVISVNMPRGVNKSRGTIHGSIGRPLDSVFYDERGNKYGPLEVRRTEDGEILVRGPTVMRGYKNKPEETREALKDGWLHTGDLANMDKNGVIFFNARLKEKEVLSSGENVFPPRIEAELGKYLPSNEIFVTADGKSRPVIYVFKGNSSVSDETMSEAVKEANRELNTWEMITRNNTHIIDGDIPGDFVTPTKKIKRIALRQYLEGLYSDDT